MENKTLNQKTLTIFAPVLILIGIAGFVIPERYSLTSGAAPYNLFHIFFGAIGLFLVFSQNNWGMRILGIAIVIAPHFVPAPQPAVESSLAPAELQSQFRVATTIANAAFWLALGVASAAMFRKLVNTGSQTPA